MIYKYPELMLPEDSMVIRFYESMAYKYFDLEELLSENIIKHYGILGLNFIHDNILTTLVGLREYYKCSANVNNWKFIKDKNMKVDSSQIFDERIVRFPDSEVYRPGSRHSVIIENNKLKKPSDACDVVFSGITSEMVRNDIRKNKNQEPFKLINAIEKNVSWLHYDNRPVKNRIFEF